MKQLSYPQSEKGQVEARLSDIQCVVALGNRTDDPICLGH